MRSCVANLNKTLKIGCFTWLRRGVTASLLLSRMRSSGDTSVLLKSNKLVSLDIVCCEQKQNASSVITNFSQKKTTDCYREHIITLKSNLTIIHQSHGWSDYIGFKHSVCSSLSLCWGMTCSVGGRTMPILQKKWDSLLNSEILKFHKIKNKHDICGFHLNSFCQLLGHFWGILVTNHGTFL